MNRMQYVPNRPTTTAKPSTGNELRDRWHLLAGLLDRLLHLDRDDEAFDDDFNAAELLLQTLPFATDPFGLAMNRLRNARRYLESCEVGAARYELRLLGCGLKSVLSDQTS